MEIVWDQQSKRFYEVGEFILDDDSKWSYTMGLPVLTVENDLAANWRMILERNGLNVRLDQNEIEKQKRIKELYPIAEDKRDTLPRWVEEPWIVEKDKVEIRVLEATRRDQSDVVVFLIFMPISTREGHQLFLDVQQVLISSGAMQGRKK